MNKKKTIWSGITGVVASVLAFLGVVSCCGMPIIAGILATLGIGASQLSFFAEYKGWFIAFAIISLIYGFYQAYFKGTKSCCASSDSETKEKKKSVLPKVFLWIGTIITLVALFTETPESSGSSASGCCPSQVSSSCTSGCNTENSGCCPISGNQQDAGKCCSSQQETIQENCCGN
jgi:hypothetical protein